MAAPTDVPNAPLIGYSNREPFTLPADDVGKNSNTAIAAAALAGIQGSNTIAAGFATSMSTQLSGDASSLPILAGSNAFTGQNTFSIGTITTSKPFALSQTWNAGGVTFAGFTVNVTDTASATGSLVGTFQLAGANLLSVNKNGNVNIGTRTETGKLTVAGLQGNYFIGFYDGSGNPYGGIGHGGGGFLSLDSGSPVIISSGGTTKFKFNTTGILDFTAGTIASSVATASTHKLTVTVAGTTYYLLASNV